MNKTLAFSHITMYYSYISINVNGQVPLNIKARLDIIHLNVRGLI